jgi:L,D-transpeptidase YcbB
VGGGVPRDFGGVSERVAKGCRSGATRVAIALAFVAACLAASPVRAAHDVDTSATGIASGPPPVAEVTAPVPVGPLAALLGRLLAGASDDVIIADQRLPASPLRAAYARAGYQPIWTDENGGLRPAGLALLQGLQAARMAGMDMVDPLLAEIARLSPAKAAADLATLELLLSAALVAATAGSGDWPPEALLVAARIADPHQFVGAHLPASFFYWRLHRALSAYQHLATAGGWPVVPGGPKLEKGISDPRVAALGQRLLATGDLTQLGPRPALFDDALAGALRRFQARHGLDADGKLGTQTLAALNIPAERRVADILLNLERFRKLGAAIGERYLYINIAGMELSLVEHGRVTFFNRVIVGRRDRETPLLRSVVRRVDFNPTWIVPPKIARIDLLNHLHQDSRYFRLHNIRVYDGWSADARELDPDSIDWTRYSADNMPFVLRQDPGPENALGPVKFDFANDYAVYVHGTPVKALFGFAARAFSSGCIRMEQPVDLAAYLLRSDKNWPRARINDVVRKATTVSAALAEPLPILLTYQTAWVDGDGTVQFRADVYGLDHVGSAEASAAAPASPSPAASAPAWVAPARPISMSPHSS